MDFGTFTSVSLEHQVEQGPVVSTYTLGMGSEADLARHMSRAGLNNFPPAHHVRAKILAKWNDLKDSPTENLTWKDACVKVKELKDFCSDSEAAEIPPESVQKMKEKFTKAEAQADGWG